MMKTKGFRSRASRLALTGLVLSSFSTLSTLAADAAHDLSMAEDPWVLTGTTRDLNPKFAPVLANGFIGTVVPALGSNYKNDTGRHILDGYYLGPIGREVKSPIQRWDCLSFNNGVHDCDPTATEISGYQQQLNLRRGTVETRYRWTDSGRSADIRILTLVSRNDPHLAAIQYTVTPDFDGPVAFKVALDGRNSGPRIKECGEEHQVLWMRNAVGEPTNLEAATAVKALFSGCQPELKKSGDLRELVQTASFVATKGTTYTLTAFMAVTKKGDPHELRQVGESVSEACQMAENAAKDGWETLYSRHCQAWENYWKTDIQIAGPGPEVAHYQKVIRTCLYNLVSTARPDGVFALDACGFMQAGWGGSMFWDSDFFMRPVLAMLHPALSVPALRYRINRLKAAQENARNNGLQGACYPWMSRYSGGENADETYRREIHNNGDIVWSFWLHYQLTGDREWLSKEGWPVIREIANFIVSRAVERNGRWEVLHVVSPDEYNNKADNDVFTNAVFQRALQIAGKTAALVGETPDPRWMKVAGGLYLPFDPTRQLYVESEGFNRKLTKQAAVEMLLYPLELPMSLQVKRKLLDFYGGVVDRKHGPAMTHSFYAIGYAEIGEMAQAYAAFKASIDPYLRPPFNIFTETPGNTLTDMTTGKAAVLMGVLNGFAGLRVRDDGVHFQPRLPKEWTALKLTHLPIGHGVYDIAITGNEFQAELVGGQPDIALFDGQGKKLFPK